MIAWFDRRLGRVTMYGLVIVCLAVVGLVALVLAFIPNGPLSFSPLALLATASVLLVTSYLANGLGGLILRTRPQLSSTVITALLLLFILRPSIEVLPLLGAALAAVVAVVSKYLVAWRGRHILNPAAAGAFVIGFLPSLGFAAWWIGIPQLLPVVAVGAVLILFRTRRLLLGLVYTVVVVAVLELRGLVDGGVPTELLSLALVSLPTVFVAGFMLSEPLTLPPRRWQQLAEAALVGLLTVMPFSLVGGIYNSPQLALLVGNVLAFLVGQRRGIRLRFVERRALTPTSWDFAFAPTAPVRFRPGQYMELALPHSGTDARGWRRVFSIASAPESGELRFGVRLPDKPSSFKTALLELEPGTAVSATSVSGDFLLPRDPGRKLLLLAGGIGVTPFVGQLQQAAVETPERDIVLVSAIASGAELAYGPELAATGFRVVVVAPDRPADLPDGLEWVEGSSLTADIVHALVPDAPERTALVSGAPAAVRDLKRALRGSGVRRVLTDTFIGY
ncbi:ferredoxin--NADP reductase [Pseudolysinimonas sp.]|uniref:ferredoxin--NADP reductase n=1 Tax=Pseudolysinimonas sp. TaxID=2680009 RepID=UPI003F7E4AFC